MISRFGTRSSGCDALGLPRAHHCLLLVTGTASSSVVDCFAKGCVETPTLYMHSLIALWVKGIATRSVSEKEPAWAANFPLLGGHPISETTAAQDGGQLLLANIRQEGDFWYLDINDQGECQSLKVRRDIGRLRVIKARAVIRWASRRSASKHAWLARIRKRMPISKSK